MRIFINAGTGEWLNFLGELPGGVEAVLCTHYFRDHSAGAGPAADRGIAVYAPYWEREAFIDPAGRFQRSETYIIYDNNWDLFAPFEAIPVTGWLMDWDTVTVAGMSFHVLPTPGQSLGAVSLEIQVGGKKALFCGEVIHSPGKTFRVAPLQYNYNDLTGAMNLIHSSRLLGSRGADLLLPSMGYPIDEDPKGALSSLEKNVIAMLKPRPGSEEFLRSLDADPLIEISPHLFQSRYAGACTYFVVSDSGKALSIDYGYLNFRSYGGDCPRYRRSFIHGLDGLEKRFGTDRLDLVVVTHFHDDHVNGIPLLQRIHGTRCWAGENFAHILANPSAYRFPCTWPEPVDVESKPLGKPLQWEEYTITLHPMSGHTRWSTLAELTVDGRKVIATGDQYFFENKAAPGEAPMMHNHVYRNGAFIDSFSRSRVLIEKIRPDLVLPGHGLAYETNPAFYEALADYDTVYQKIHRQLMPLGLEDVHFELDSRAGWLEPYRSLLPASGELRYRAVVRNPLPKAALLNLSLFGPAGWKGSSRSIEAGPREEIRSELTITPPPGIRVRRQAVGLDLRIEDRPFGAVAEALVTIGYPVF